MRKIIASLFVSLDGVAESPDKWHFPYFNDEMGNAVGAAMANSDTMLLGRVQYQQFAAYWPTSDDEVADFMNNQKKYVVTNTLTEATWNNTEIISGDVPGRIKTLKSAEGEDIGVTAVSPSCDHCSRPDFSTSCSSSSTRSCSARAPGGSTASIPSNCDWHQPRPSPPE
jgi:RibD C-terminal domain